MYFEKAIVRAELSHLRQTGRRSKIYNLKIILVACNLILILVPFLATIYYADINLHTVLIIGLVLFCLGYEVYTIVLAIGAIDHEHQNRTWNNLILTGVDGRKIISSKWRALVQHLLETCLWLTLSKLAIAYSLMQLLNVYPSWIDAEINLWNRSFLYMSYENFEAITPIAYYPQLWQVILAFLVLAVLSVAEIGLLASFGILVAFIKTSLPFAKLLSALLLRIFLSAAGIVSVPISGLLDGVVRYHLFTVRNVTSWAYWGCDSEYHRQNVDYYNWCVVEREYRRVFEALQVSVVSLADNGALLAANIMRPIGTSQFALRNVLSAILSLLIIALVTILGLWVGGKLVNRQSI